VMDPEGPEHKRSFKATHRKIEGGGIISFRTGGGGGYGNPLERDLNEVLRDVQLGYVSIEKARTEYGVVVSNDKKSIDLLETTKLRSNSNNA
jgi:N-methylhydantoinase B